jgi:DmsE family decaheme c-type cytochrome
MPRNDDEPAAPGAWGRESRAGEGRVIALAQRRRAIVPMSIVLSVAVLVACAQLWLPGPLPRTERTEPVFGAGPPLGASQCDACHGHQPASAHHNDCESCHGSGGLHLQNVEYTENIRFPSSTDCLDCHARGTANHVDWIASDHDSADIPCSSCHDPHNAEPRHLRLAAERTVLMLPHATPSTQLCVDCHRDVGARLSLPSHHPVREGMLDCISCHSPHGSIERDLGSQNEGCEGCHEAQTGPWVYEHLPVTEDCGLCHAPHGSAAQDLLRANQPGVCASCHTIAEMGATHDGAAYVTRCTDCHGAVHGSYDDPHLRR